MALQQERQKQCVGQQLDEHWRAKEKQEREKERKKEYPEKEVYMQFIIWGFA